MNIFQQIAILGKSESVSDVVEFDNMQEYQAWMTSKGIVND